MGHRWICLSIVLALVALAVGTARTSGSNVVQSPEALTAVRDRAESLVRSGDVPSLAIAVSFHGQIIWMEAFGTADREGNTPATVDTSYALASITKPFTATALMQLVEEGSLSLGDPASLYLGDAQMISRVGDVADVTVASLASHTSGLPLHSQAYYVDLDEPCQPAPFDQTLRCYGNLTTAPGERYQYSNLGYGVLGYILERLTGRSYGKLMAERVFDPLGLRHTFVGPPGTDQDNVAAKHDSDGHRVPPATSDCSAACAIYSSVSDLIRFAEGHLRGSTSADSGLLSASSLLRMQVPAHGTQPTRSWECAGGGYGIGWFVGFLDDGLRIVDHSGGACGIGTSLILVPEEQLAVAVLCNTHGPWADEIAISVVSALIPHRLANVCVAADNPAPVAEAVTDVEPQLEGTWVGAIETCERSIPLRLCVDDEGQAWIRISGGTEQQLEQVSYVEDSPILMNAGGGRYLRGAMPGGLLTSAVLRGCPCRTWIELRLIEDRLQGAVICLSQRDFWTGPLSFWAELTREESGE